MPKEIRDNPFLLPAQTLWIRHCSCKTFCQLRSRVQNNLQMGNTVRTNTDNKIVFGICWRREYFICRITANKLLPGFACVDRIWLMLVLCISRNRILLCNHQREVQHSQYYSSKYLPLIVGCLEISILLLCRSASFFLHHVYST